MRFLSSSSRPGFTANDSSNSFNSNLAEKAEKTAGATVAAKVAQGSVFAAREGPVPENSGPVPVTVDRELPDPFAAKKQNRLYFLAYGLGVFASCAIIFNYEKTRSPIINSVLYCLRRSNTCTELLGANINFRNAWPWIWGTLSTAQGKIDILFDVKGDRSPGTLRLRAARLSRLHPFDIYEWSLEVDGKTVDLLKDETIEANF